MKNPHPYIDSGVYALLLDGENYYVGASTDIHRRLDEHEYNRTAWTDMHNVISVDDIFPARCQLKRLEREVTIAYMEKYGWKSVRGAGWTEAELESEPIPLR